MNYHSLYVYTHPVLHSASSHHVSRVHRARLTRYLDTHYAAIAGAEVVRITYHPCKVMPLPKRKVSTRPCLNTLPS